MNKWIKKALGILLVAGLTMGMALPVAVYGQAKPEGKPKVAKKVAKKASPQAMRIQRALKKAGFNPGPVDGISGKKTRAAVRAFQKANGLKADGIARKMTLAKLKPFMEEK